MHLKGPPHDRGEDKTHWVPQERETAKIVQEDFSGSIADPKWRNAPQDIKQAEAAIVGLQCPMCYSTLLLPIIRPPANVWKVHCNHCATEIPIVVLINRVAWMDD